MFFFSDFFLYACVFDTYQIFECGNQNYYKKLRTYFIFRIMGNFLSILSINSLQLFILRNDDLFIMRQNHKVQKKTYSKPILTMSLLCTGSLNLNCKISRKV